MVQLLENASFHPMCPTKRRKVTFAPCAIILIPTITDEEARLRWYNKKEYEEIRKYIVETLRYMMMTTNSNPSRNCYSAGGGGEFCTRGLELMTPAGTQHTKQIKLKLLAAVWNAQVEQWDSRNELFDQEAIANASRHETAQCARLARSLGVLDEQEANNNTLQRKTIQTQPIVSAPRQTTAFGAIAV